MPRILVAEDDAASRRLIEVSLSRAGYEVLVASSGEEALDILDERHPPELVILDWLMPGRDGIDICREIRARATNRYLYVMLVTSKARAEDVVRGLEAGADDYLTKPYDPHELRCRVATGMRILELQAALSGKIDELEQALAHVQHLQGLLPICMYCKKIRDDKDSWHRLETYIERNSSAMFSHSLCEDCREEHYPALSSAIGGEALDE